MSELQRFLGTWEFETDNTVKLLKALPKDQYDFRPDADGRSLGELAWHLAEVDAYMTNGISNGTLAIGSGRPPGIERPRTIEALVPNFERVHREAVERVKKLTPEDLGRQIPFFNGHPIAIRDILWGAVLHHSIHHRAQLHLMVRLAGAVPPSMYGPSREDTLAMKAKVQAPAKA
jgi:uncharacterized damage-inducible protein DinB